MQSVPTTTSTTTDKPHLVIRPGRNRSLFNFREVWLYRDLIIALATRDIKLRYKQTVLGALWVVIQPLLSAGVFSFIFNTVADLPTDGVPPYLYSFSGMILWTVFSSVVGKTSNIMVANSSLVSKVYFPRICLPLSVIPSVCIDLCISFVVLVALMIYYGVAPSIAIIFWPLIVVLTMIFALGIGLVTTALSVTYRDIQYILPVVMNLLMYASPIAYSASKIANSTSISSFGKSLYYLNPLVELLSISRFLLIGQGHFHPIGLLTSCVVVIVTAFLGLTCFRALERKFADVI